jgi:hypothetical protein
MAVILKTNIGSGLKSAVLLKKPVVYTFPLLSKAIALPDSLPIEPTLLTHSSFCEKL